MKTGFYGRLREYVQLPAKLACLMPFLLALAYTLFVYRQVAAVKTLVFFVSMLAFDMSVTGLNNYMDSKEDGMPLPFSRPTAKRILVILWMISGLGAVQLVYWGGLTLFALGALCFLVGIAYSFGPAPLSRMPLGEIFSGVFEGFFIPFLVVYINAPEKSLVWYAFVSPSLLVGMNIRNLLSLAVLTAPAMLGIAGIMLANNICDMENDVKVRRYTLPYYIGVKNALRLFAVLYAAACADIAVMAVFGVLPPYVLAVLPGFAVVAHNIKKFNAVQSKKATFPLSIANFLIMLVPLILVAAIAALLRSA